MHNNKKRRNARSYLGKIARLQDQQDTPQLQANGDALLKRRFHIYGTNETELSWVEWFDWSEPYHQRYYGTPCAKPEPEIHNE